MFNLIIAEDEKMLLDRLTGIVDYKNYGFNLVAKFSNGQDVIDYMERYHVDLIISDIRMPKATGLDVAKYVYERKKVISENVEDTAGQNSDSCKSGIFVISQKSCQHLIEQK